MSRHRRFDTVRVRRDRETWLWAATAGLVAFAATCLLTDNLMIIVGVAAAGSAIALGANRGLPYLVLFSLLCVATGAKLGPFTIGDAFAVGAAVFGLIGRAIHRERIPVTWAYIGPIGILLWGLLTAVSTGTNSVNPLLIFVGSMVIVIAAVTLPVRTERQLTLVAMAFTIGATLNAAVGMLDYVGVVDTNQITGFGGNRPPALTTHSNQLGLVSNLALPFAYHFTARNKAWALSVAALLGGAFVSGSRGALLGAAIVTIIYILVSGHRIFRRTLVAVCFVLVAVVIAESLGVTTGLTRLGGDATADQSDAERLRRIGVAWAEFQANPFIGVGYSTAEAHNFYLELLRSGGLPALIIMLAFLSVVLHRGWQIKDEIYVATPAISAFATWIALAVQNNALNVRFIWITPAILLAAVSVARNRGVDDSRHIRGNYARVHEDGSK